MAQVSTDSRRRGVEMLQKGDLMPVFARASTTSIALSNDSSDIETEFEDDLSEFDDYTGRRSEDSYGKRSDTTVSTFEELRTPSSNEFKGFNFQLPTGNDVESPKKIVGPSGPHLFRYSSESAQDQEVSIEWSPIDSPQRAGPSGSRSQQSHRSVVPQPDSLPLECWSPPVVAGWVRSRGLGEGLVNSLLTNDISGTILKELKFGDLKELGIDSFGQRHQLWDEIRQLRGSIILPSPATEEQPPTDHASVLQQTSQPRRPSPCSNPQSPANANGNLPVVTRRRARRALRPDDVISPAESASIVAIEQLLPKPHHCSKGENCAKWRKQQRQLARIAKEFPLELEQIGQAEKSPSETGFRPTSDALPSVVASSDVLGPGLPSLRLDEEVLRVVPPRDPQESVRQFLDFQHLNEPEPTQPASPPYEMFPPLSPPSSTPGPHSNLSRLPKLSIPSAPNHSDLLSPDRTVVNRMRSPLTAFDLRGAPRHDRDSFRMASPASTMDVPVTAIPIGPIERDVSQSVPPNMQYGNGDPTSRSASRAGFRKWDNASPILRPQTATEKPGHNLSRAPSHSRRNQQRSRQPSFAMAPLDESSQAVQQFDMGNENHEHLKVPQGMDRAEITPIAERGNEPSFAGWMKKRKTKMLRHEWHENHFRLNGTTLAMHRDSKVLEALDYIDLDDYAVACSSMASNRKLGAAFKNFKITGGGKKKEGAQAEDAASSAFCFQLVPSSAHPDGGKSGLLATAMASASGKTHHFAVKNRDERIDWMRELMLAKALKEKGKGCEVNVNGNMV